MEGSQPGHTVKFQGLKGAAHLNGTEGTLVKYIKKEERWSVRCESNDVIVKAKSENLVRKKYPKTTTKKNDSRRSSYDDCGLVSSTHRKEYDAKEFASLFDEDGHEGGSGTTTTTTTDVTDFRSILSPADGMPPLWPRPPSWPFDPKLTKSMQTNYPSQCSWSPQIKG